MIVGNLLRGADEVIRRGGIDSCIIHTTARYRAILSRVIGAGTVSRHFRGFRSFRSKGGAGQKHDVRI
jgi:hypothetical protein